MRITRFLKEHASNNMKIIISEEKDMTGQTFKIFLTKQNIRLIWHESETGVINWALEFLSDSSSGSDEYKKKNFSFVMDGSKDDERGWLNRSNIGNETFSIAY